MASQQAPQRQPLSQNSVLLANEVIGSGATGKVCLGSFQGKKCAIKIIETGDLNPVTKYLLNCEINALKRLSDRFGPNSSSVHLFEVLRNDKHCFLVTELLEGGTLAQLIEANPQGIAINLAVSIFNSLANSYGQMKDCGIIHRDIKPDNIIFRYKNDYENPVFIDFGYCTVQGVPDKPNAYYNVGSPTYMSPEAFTKANYSQKSDIWALGTVLYQMITGKPFDYGKTTQQSHIDLKAKGPFFPPHIPDPVRRIIIGMVYPDERLRLSILEVKRLIFNNQGQIKAGRMSSHEVKVKSPKANGIDRTVSSKAMNQNHPAKPVPQKPPMSEQMLMAMRQSCGPEFSWVIEKDPIRHQNVRVEQGPRLNNQTSLGQFNIDSKRLTSSKVDALPLAETRMQRKITVTLDIAQLIPTSTFIQLPENNSRKSMKSGNNIVFGGSVRQPEIQHVSLKHSEAQRSSTYQRQTQTVQERDRKIQMSLNSKDNNRNRETMLNLGKAIHFESSKLNQVRAQSNTVHSPNDLPIEKILKPSNHFQNELRNSVKDIQSEARWLKPNLNPNPALRLQVTSNRQIDLSNDPQSLKMSQNRETDQRHIYIDNQQAMIYRTTVPLKQELSLQQYSISHNPTYLMKSEVGHNGVNRQHPAPEMSNQMHFFPNQFVQANWQGKQSAASHTTHHAVFQNNVPREITHYTDKVPQGMNMRLSYPLSGPILPPPNINEVFAMKPNIQRQTPTLKASNMFQLHNGNKAPLHVKPFHQVSMETPKRTHITFTFNGADARQPANPSFQDSQKKVLMKGPGLNQSKEAINMNGKVQGLNHSRKNSDGDRQVIATVHDGYGMPVPFNHAVLADTSRSPQKRMSHGLNDQRFI